MGKVWVDIFNGPHVHFFQNIESYLKEPVLYTGRHYSPIPQLVELYKMQVKIIGKHGGVSNSEKLIASANRIIDMAKYISENNEQISCSIQKHSVEAARIAWGLGIPSISYIDNELMTPQNMLVCPLSKVLIAPIAISQYTLRNFTPAHVNIIQYDGVSEIANIDNFKPNESVLKQLDLDTNKPIIVLRSRPVLASYNKGNSIVEKIKEKIRSDIKDAQIIHVNRVGEKQFCMDNTFDARSLSYYADLVISGGGTMTREAALLGTNAISYFKNPLAVDRYLINEGLLQSYPEEKILTVDFKKEVNKKKKKVQLSNFEHPFSKLDKAIKLINRNS